MIDVFFYRRHTTERGGDSDAFVIICFVGSFIIYLLLKAYLTAIFFPFSMYMPRCGLFSMRFPSRV